MVFIGQLFLHKLFTNTFMLDLNIPQYPTLLDLINNMEDSDVFQLYDT